MFSLGTLVHMHYRDQLPNRAVHATGLRESPSISSLCPQQKLKHTSSNNACLHRSLLFVLNKNLGTHHLIMLVITDHYTLHHLSAYRSWRHDVTMTSTASCVGSSSRTIFRRCSPENRPTTTRKWLISSGKHVRHLDITAFLSIKALCQ